MAIEYNFDGLTSIYKDAIDSYDKTMIFESEIGRGRFLFMMFLSEEDKEAKDNLFIYLRSTNILLRKKLYGNHLKGTFKLYIEESEKTKLINELQLMRNGSQSFDFMRFLHELNLSIPPIITKKKKIESLRSNLAIIKPLNVVSEVEKTVLIGEKRLPVGQTPQDKTLRKLYIYTDSDETDVSELIRNLKRMNMTVQWTTEKYRDKAKEIREIVNRISN